MSEMPVTRPPVHPWLKPVLFGLGWVCVALGVLGLVTPGLPGVVFLIAAAALFSRSSPRFEHWLLSHARLGPPVIAWRRSGAIGRVPKVLILGSLTFSFVLIAHFDPHPLAIAATALCFIATGAFVFSRPEA